MLRKPAGTDFGLLGREALAAEIFSTAHDPAKSKRKAWRQDHYQSCRTLIEGNATMDCPDNRYGSRALMGSLKSFANVLREHNCSSPAPSHLASVQTSFLETRNLDCGKR